MGLVGARPNRRHGERLEDVVDDGARDLPAISGADPIVGDAVEQLEFGRLAKVPERAEADDFAGRGGRQPQSEALFGEEREAPGDDVGGLVAREDLVVEDEAANTRLREDRVQRIAIVVRNRAENQTGGVERRYFFRTRSITTS